MRKIGSVAAILDTTRLLVKLDSPSDFIVEGQLLTAFAQVLDPHVSDLGLKEIYIPKGDLRVVLKQDAGFVLVERFKQVKTDIKRTKKPGVNPFIDVFGGTFEEVEVSSPGGWSANIDTDQSLNMKFVETIQVGDPVGTK